MKTIRIDSSLSTNILLDFQNVTSIEIESKPLAEGAFGEVYICKSVNGKSVAVPQVIKLFKEGQSHKQDHNFITVQKLQRKISTLNQRSKVKSGKSITDEYPALKGIPQFSFEGNINGKNYRGFSSTNLKLAGFEEFIEILENDISYALYQKIDIDKKMLIAFHLVSAFKVLQEISFIHADLKPEAIFINTNLNECAIIDYDSGVITESANDTPNTWGAPNDWVAPEIWEQLKQNGLGGLQKVKVNLLTDMWSVAVGIHYILTTVHPLFYLTELSPKVAIPYFRQYKWPEIRESEPYFNPKNQRTYRVVKSWLENSLATPIFVQLSNSVNYGYLNPIKRTTYNQWEKVLIAVQEPPIIKRFSFSVAYLLSGDTALLDWEVLDSTNTTIKGVGSVESIGKIEIKPTTSTTYDLTAENAFGKVKKTILVTVLPRPVISDFKPKHHKIECGRETFLNWKVTNAAKVEIFFNEKKETLSFEGAKKIKPLKNTSYKLIATGLDGKTTVETEVVVQVFEKIKIKSFRSDFAFIVDSIPVTLYWEIENANELVLLDNFGNSTDVTNKTELKIHLKRDTTFFIKCKNDLFEASSKTRTITTVQNEYELDLKGLVPDLKANDTRDLLQNLANIPNLNYDDLLNIQIVECNITINSHLIEVAASDSKQLNRPQIVEQILNKIRSLIQV